MEIPKRAGTVCTHNVGCLCGWEGFISATPASIMQICRRIGTVYILNVGCLCVDKKVFIPATPTGILEILRRTKQVQYTLAMLVVSV